MLILFFDVVPLGSLLFLYRLTSVLWGGSYLFIIHLQTLIFLAFVGSMAFHSVGVYVDVHDGVSFLVRGFEERSPVPLGILDISVESFGCIFNFLEILLESH